MVSAYDTTVEWQAFTGDTIILPVGSTEQHSDYLPLATDVLQINNYAQAIARELGAALLPTQPFGTCMEHSGFRGSFGLTPTTLMNLLHDLAEEAERQNFKFMVVLNGHGGNFSLAPACRDWNRRNRALKIILVAPSEFCPSEVFDRMNFARPEFHAGAYETSLMSYLHPDLVKTTRGIPMADVSHEEFPIAQRDLNTFGVGYLNAGGTVGYPEYASAELGRKMAEGAIARVVPWIKERIERLRVNSNYTGPGGILVRRAVAGDIDSLDRLKAAAGWNQSSDDLEFFLQHYPETLWVAVQNGRVIGSTSAAIYSQQMAWIGMVLVDPAYRQMGVGKKLMEVALAALHEIPQIKLDATPAGKRIYDKLDFKDECLLYRMVRQAGAGVREAVPAGVRPMSATDFEAIVESDSRVFGAARRELLLSVYQRAPHLAWVDTADPAAFSLGRPGALYTQLGPVVAADDESAMRLITAALHSLNGGAAMFDVPATQQRVIAYLEERGFVTTRHNMRMYLGANIKPGEPDKLRAVAGLEFG
ncbi:MAG: GNAT family N-acetyltransferase [Lentisphaerae bacterium]|nr:GNAT family N-acetyltransferase [Lentisphaerota bacterium]